MPRVAVSGRRAVGPLQSLSQLAAWPGMRLLLDAQVLGLADGAAMTSWADQSPLGNNATGGTSTYRSTGGSGGTAAVEFNGTTDFYSISGPGVGITDAHTIFVVWEMLSYPGGGQESALIGTGYNTGWQLDHYGGDNNVYGYQAGGGGNGCVTASSVALNTWAQVSYSTKGFLGSVRFIRLNGAASNSIVSAANMTTPQSSIQIVKNTITGNFLNGRISAIAVLNRVTDADETTLIESFLAARYSMTAIPTTGAVRVPVSGRVAVSQRTNLSGYLYAADFTTLDAGAAVSMPAPLLHERNSVATVQTGTSTVVSSLAVNVAGVGRRLDADNLGLVIDEARTCILLNNRDTTKATWAGPAAGATVTPAYSAGPDGGVILTAARMVVAAGDYGRYSPQGVAATTYVVSAWQRRVTGAGAGTWRFTYDGSSRNATGAITDAWQRNVTAKFAATNDAQLSPVDSQGFGTALDVVTDLHQVEAGGYATEAIVTAGVATARAGARLYHPTGVAALVNGGGISFEFRFRPKGTLSDYPVGNPALFYIDGNNYLNIAASNGNMNVVCGGNTWNPGAAAVNWAANDTVDVAIEMGGGNVSRFAYRLNGGAAVKTAGPYQPNINGTGAVDLLNVAGTNQLTSWLELFRAYPLGRRPSWAQ